MDHDADARNRSSQATDGGRSAAPVPMPASSAKSTTPASRAGPRRAISRRCAAASVSHSRVHGHETTLRSSRRAEPRTHTVALERRLSIDHGTEALTVLTGEAALATASETRAVTSASEGASPTLVSPCQDSSIWDGEIHVQVPPLTPTSAPLSFSTFKFPPTPPSPPARSTFVDDLMRADLYDGALSDLP